MHIRIKSTPEVKNKEKKEKKHATKAGRGG
jgi:hypothetical protein